MNVQVTGGLCRRYPALPDQLDRLNLELSTESSSPHDYLRFHETPKLGVHQTVSVFGIALRYEDLNDHETLRHDPLMAVLAGTGSR